MSLDTATVTTDVVSNKQNMWESFHIERDEETGYEVRVTKSTFLDYPRYSIKFGILHNGKFSEFFQPWIQYDVQNGTVEMKPIRFDIMNRLLANAEHCIFLDAENTAEQLRIKKVKSVHRSPGKTERDRQKVKDSSKKTNVPPPSKAKQSKDKGKSR
jgi:hypothetical protein